MQLITNKISTGKPGRFEDFIKKFKASQVKTASVKTAEEQDEAESSGQLKVEPLHQTGESTTMPKNGPSAKKDDGEKAAAADTDPEKEGKDSGQPKAEGSEKFTNNVKFDPNDSTDEEKGIDASAGTTVKVAGETCEGCNCPKNECECKDCTADSDEDETDKKEKTAALEDLPQEVQDKIKGKKSDGDDDDKEEKDDEKEAKTDDEDKEEKEASAKCNKCDCEPCECKDVCASKKIKFLKWANLDSKNKSFITTYWRQLFGDDYVNALVADK